MKTKRDPKTGRFVRSDWSHFWHGVWLSGYVGVCLLSGYLGAFFGAGR